MYFWQSGNEESTILQPLKRKAINNTKSIFFMALFLNDD